MKLYIYSIVIAIIFISCNDENNSIVPPDPPDEDTAVSYGIVPLKKGFFWKYKEFRLNEEGNIRSELMEHEYRVIKSSVSGIGEMNDTVFHRVYVSTVHNIPSEFEWLFRNYHDGLYLMGGIMPSDTMEIKLLDLKYPMAKGEIWEKYRLVYNLIEEKYLIFDTITYTCIDTNAVFETPLGNFNCIVYNYQMEQDEDVEERLNIFEYYSLNVGLVGRIYKGYFDHPDSSYFKSKWVLYQTNVQ
ncbi:MAG: hypothetical protein R6W90_07080 [Ignavibacteriaceae bacterium]